MSAGDRALEVLAPGAATTVQDLGRPGHAAAGVPQSGAADQEAHRAANRLVGNPAGAAGLEVLLGHARFAAVGRLRVAVTGAAGPLTVRAGGRVVPAPLAVAFPLQDGAVLELGPADYGVRYSVAVRGGLLARRVLGSRATDVLSGLGPPPLASGDRIPVGPEPAQPAPTTDLPWPRTAPRGEAVLRALPGPRLDRFVPDALPTLLAVDWTVSPASNRVGLRLSGPPLERSRREELPSEGMVTGALQVPPDGRPILFLADHPTTGGYPVLAVVATADLGLAAQLRPGDVVRFVG